MVLPRAILAAFPFELWPDEIAARMAFKDAYPAKLRKYGMEVVISDGHDPGGRAPAIASAVEQGLIPPPLPVQQESDSGPVER